MLTRRVPYLCEMVDLVAAVRALQTRPDPLWSLEEIVDYCDAQLEEHQWRCLPTREAWAYLGNGLLAWRHLRYARLEMDASAR